jgi:peptidyl-dipeptidase Dcp
MKSALLSSVALVVMLTPVLAGPFDQPSTLPLQAPDFSKIQDSDYQPAIEEGMRQELAEIDAIANNPAPPTFDNTLVAMEKAGRMLSRVQAVFGQVTQANSNDVLLKVRREEAPKLAAESDAIFLNAKLFARIKAVHDSKPSLDAESQQLLNITYNRFIHAGANLSEPDKAKLRELNKQIATLSTGFAQKVLAGTKAGMLVVDDKAKLAGLSDAEIAAAAEAAKGRGLDIRMVGGSDQKHFVIPLQNTTQQPALADLADRDTRATLFDHSWTRNEKGDANDTRALISELAQLRSQKAQLLGYPNYSAYFLYDQMAQNPATVEKFLGDLAAPAAAKIADEGRQIQEAIDKDGQHFDLKPWDWERYAEKVRKARYDLDESQLKPYLELHTVLEKGVFYAATRLYGITFKRRTDLPTWHPDVMVYDVIDKDGSQLGLFYADYFKRDNKAGGAWTSGFVPASKLLGTKPVVTNTANFPKPAAGQPALLTFEDVRTMFHEFGHALHSLFNAGKYTSLGAARDWVEFPSQFNEHWALEPSVLKNYAVNYKTGEVMPQALVDKIKSSSTWDQGYTLGELLAASELDMQWHQLPASAPRQDVDAFETKALHDTHTDFANVPTRYRSSYFQHIWSGGYASGYYAYQWTVMLADDAYAWIDSHGGLTRANGERMRDLILSRGHTLDYGPMFRAFYGKDPDTGPMLQHRGLTPPK